MFVMNYPKEAKAFYMKENPEDPRTVLCDDCLAPEGYGEIIGGSQREDDYDKLAAPHPRGRTPVDAYGWYLDLRKYGTFVHSGFGLGLERTVAWICGLPHIREVIAFPRMMHRRRDGGTLGDGIAVPDLVASSAVPSFTSSQSRIELLELTLHRP